MEAHQRRRTDQIWHAGIVVIVIGSFFLFSYRYYPFFNSDSALAVLMAADFHWPRDIYCWGQNRGGTLEMLLAGILISCFESNALITASLVHYSLLVTGLLAGFWFIHTPFARFALTVLWFFPSYLFLEIVLYQFGVQFSLLILGMVFLDKSLRATKRKSFWLSLTWVALILNVWILDHGILPVSFLILFALAYRTGKNQIYPLPKQSLAGITRGKYLAISIFWLIAGTAFITWAKYLTRLSTSRFDEINLLFMSGWPDSLVNILHHLSDLLVFRGAISESIYVYSGLLLGAMIFMCKKKNPRDFFMRYFLYNALFCCLFLLFISRAMVNEIPIRYFTVCYLSFSIYLVMLYERKSVKSTAMAIAWGTFLIASIASSVHQNFIPKNLQPMVDNFNFPAGIKPVGVIGSYWHSYVFAAIDPDSIKATPHENGLVRNPDLAREVMWQPHILLIKNDWLQSFPDSITQFGIVLKKEGEPFLLGTYYSWEEKNDVMACSYKRNDE